MDDDKLINLVQEQPSIYDKTHVYYTNKQYSKTVWGGIAVQMNQPVNVCQKRWRYLRDYFVRQLHIHGLHYGISSNLSTGPASTKKSYWALFDRMFFLAPFSSTRKMGKKSLSSSNNNNNNNRSSNKRLSEQSSVLSISSTSSQEALTDMDLDYSTFLQAQFYNGGDSSQKTFMYNNIDDEQYNMILNDQSQTIGEDQQNDLVIQKRSVDNNLANIVSTKTTATKPTYNQNYQSASSPPSSSSKSLSAAPVGIIPEAPHQPTEQPPKKKRKTSEIYEELLTMLKQQEQQQSTDHCDEHEHFFKSLLRSVRQISGEHIMSFRTEILQVIMKYQYMSQGDKLLEQNGSSNSDVVVIDTGELHWRHNLSRYQ